MIEAAVEMDDDAMEATWKAKSPTSQRCAADPQGHLGDEVRSCAVWVGVQKQRRSASAQRCDRLSASPAGRCRLTWAFKPGDETETRNIPRRADDDMAVFGLAFKIMNDPFRWHADLHADLFGQMNKGDTMLNSTKGRKSALAG